MATMQNTQMYTQDHVGTMQDWSGEISPAPEWGGMRGAEEGRFRGTGQKTAPGGLQMRTPLPAEVVETPSNTQEAYLGSLKAMLMRNKGNYIVATFLVGTQTTVSWEGVLYDVGNDYVTIYQEGRDRYIVCDMYSLRYMEFYDIRRRELCDRLLAGQNWQAGM